MWPLNRFFNRFEDRMLIGALYALALPKSHSATNSRLPS